MTALNKKIDSRSKDLDEQKMLIPASQGIPTPTENKVNIQKK